jgi:hypothetical protein
MSFTCPDVKYFDFVVSLSCSFPFPPPPRSIVSFYCYNMFYVYTSVCSCLFLSTHLPFATIFHIWEKTCGFCICENRSFKKNHCLTVWFSGSPLFSLIKHHCVDPKWILEKWNRTTY